MRFLRVFYAPARLFEEERGNPNPWPPLLFDILVPLLLLFITIPQIQPALLEQALQQVPPEQQEAVRNFMSVRTILLTGSLSILLLTPIKLALIALIYQATIPFVGGALTFRESFTAVAYATVISTLAGIVKTPVMLLRKSLQAYTDLTLFAPGLKPGSPLWIILNRIDFFTLWSLAVLIIGLATFSGVPRKRTAVLVILLWAAFVILSAFLPFGAGRFGPR